MAKKVEQFIIKLYVFIFARKFFYKFNLNLFKLSIRGLGILNFESDKVSGEKFFFKYAKSLKDFDKGVIFDVGANIGNYSIALRENGINNTLYSFEPNSHTYKILAGLASTNNFIAVQKGLSEKECTAQIFDYLEDGASEHASLFQGVFSEVHKSPYKATEIELTTVDVFVEQEKIKRIALLKIDTEGNELNVLKGAKEALKSGIIDIIQIEFNEMNVFSKTFMKDIIDILPDYKLYRLLPNELLPLDVYKPLEYELFAFQNIVGFKNQ